MTVYGQQKYGAMMYAEIQVEQDDISKLKPDLMQYVPKYYYSSLVMQNLFGAESDELALLNWHTKDTASQLFVDTATWGLALWEKQIGIYTNVSKSYAERREIIKARMRGGGTSTKAMIQSVAESFSGGDVGIIEDNANCSFIVQFVGIKGIPPNMQGLIDALETIKPAHLAYSFKYTYTVWDMVGGLTWGAVDRTWAALRVYE